MEDIEERDEESLTQAVLVAVNSHLILIIEEARHTVSR